jgi:hypothetical protein
MCDSEIPPGFVEPVPEFFARLAALVEATEAGLKQADCLASNPQQTAADLREAANVLERVNAARVKARKTKANETMPRPYYYLAIEEFLLVQRAAELLDSTHARLLEEWNEKSYTESSRTLRSLADDVEQGRAPKQPKVAKVLQEWNGDLGQQWRTLGMLCRRLESLAHKQLRRVPFSDEENNLIRGYGEKLAGIMFYGGNSYVVPRDDAPRVTDVYFNPNTACYLEVGIARPRAIYVLYPAKGGDLLCRGAILPYYEFAHDTRLTDAEWKTLLDSPQRPKTPDWIDPILAPGAPVPPKTHP